MANTAPHALVDSHCHLDLPAFKQDFELVIERAREVGVTRLHIPGTTVDRWPSLIQMAKRGEIDVSLGLHPYFLPLTDRQQLLQSIEQLESLLQQRPQGVVAVGECGLDSVIEVDGQLQEEIFSAQIGLAKQYGYPLILHARKAHHLIHKHLLAQAFGCGGVIHAFSGSAEVAAQYVDRNFMLGIGGTITYPRANKTRLAVQAVGLAHIVLETDSPDMPMNGFQGQRNTPERLPLVVNELAKLLRVDPEEVAQVTTANYLRLFQ